MNYLPMDSGGVSASYLAFHDDVQHKLDQVRADISTAIEGIRSNLESRLESPWLAASPGVGLIAHQAAENLESAFRNIWDGFADASVKIWEIAAKFTGDPDALMDLELFYNDAATRLVDEKIVIQRMVREVEKHWQGIAVESYDGLAGEQCDAIDAICSGLRTAATACAHSASALRDMRRALVDKILEYAGKISQSIKDACDLGHVLTLEAGPVIETIANFVIEVGEVCNELGRFYDQDLTVNTDLWRQLNGGLPGLTSSNDWPSLSRDDVGDMNHQHDWEPT